MCRDPKMKNLKLIFTAALTVLFDIVDRPGAGKQGAKAQKSFGK